MHSRLADLGFTEFEEEALLIDGLPVQFLSARPGLESEAVEQAMEVAWEGHRIRIMRPEHLAAIALTVGRPKDRARVVYLTALPAFDRGAFADILSRHGLSEQWKRWAKALELEE